MQLRILFFGSAPLALPVLEALKEGGRLPAVIVTMPDPVSGKRGEPLHSPVRLWAESNGIDLFQPQSISDEPLQDLLQNTEWDLFVVASYGMILPEAVLNLPKYGVLNVHPSLLPKYRGASPYVSQILNDDRECGVTIIRLDAKMDHGPILAQGRITIDPEDWPLPAPMLGTLLAEEGGKLLVETITPWVTGKIIPEDQDHGKATFTKKVGKEDGAINLSDDPYTNYLKICAYAGWPGTYFFAQRKNGQSVRVKIAEATYQNGTLNIERVIPEGKKEMSYEDFVRGL